MSDLLFNKHDLSAVIEMQKNGLIQEIDRMNDERLFGMKTEELSLYAQEKYSLDLPQLGEPQVDHQKTKMEVGRYGGYRQSYGEDTVHVDAECFTLEIPFTGDKELFLCRGSQWNSAPPRGNVTQGMVSTSVVVRSADADKINHEFDKFIADLNLWLGYLKSDVNGWNSRISAVVESHLGARRLRYDQANAAKAGLKYALKSRPESGSSYVPAITRKKIAPMLPPSSAGMTSEPLLTEDAYREILDTLQQMSEVMERSPHAFAAMDEETLRFQFLIPLNAKFEGEARGETFNYGGKTDILITHKGKNIFIAELKIWTGAKAFSDAIDQLLGYLSWRDTKTALVVFNRNKGFSAVLEQLDKTSRAHPNFISAGPKKGATEFRYTFKHQRDGERQIFLTVLAFDLPKVETNTRDER